MHGSLLRIFIVSLSISLRRSTKLNVPFLLLPSSYEPVNFTLRAEKGCYKCQYALVSALSAPHSPQSRGAAVVQAQDAVTGQTLHCDIITDRIQSIQIVTITRHLFINDTPLLLTVQAMDSAGLYVSRTPATALTFTSCLWRSWGREGTVCCCRASAVAPHTYRSPSISLSIR
uniref:Cadherin domain-containing protein n=1 Tax=Pygocentrus nattereri TaxID=42514 RepID=A0AAR2K713_PYGNA